jgi:hypothetical protein
MLSTTAVAWRNGNPQVHQGEWIEWYDGIIRKTAYDVVLMLLSDVRKKCPNAVVLYFGAFLPISYASNPNDLRAFFRHEYDDDVRWFLNWVSGDACDDVNALIN